MIHELNYRDGLITRYGLEYVDEIETRAKNTRNQGWNRTKLTERKEKYRLMNKIPKF